MPNPKRKVFKMKGFRLGRALVQSTEQQKTMGEILARAVTEGREIEVRGGNNKSVVVLVSAADDMGHVYKIDVGGGFKDIGSTE